MQRVVSAVASDKWDGRSISATRKMPRLECRAVVGHIRCTRNCNTWVARHAAQPQDLVASWAATLEKPFWLDVGDV